MISSLAWRSLLLLAAVLLAPWPLRAQDPALVSADLAYTRGAIANDHLINQVSLRVGQSKYLRYHCDRYPDVVRITEEDGTEYARIKGKSWLRSKDWGETGARVKAAKARELDTEVTVTEAPLEKSVPRDPSQGGTVWRLVDTRKEADLVWFTYEESREKPRPDGVYPRYTFVKYKGDKDG